MGCVTHGQKNDHSPLILLRFWLVIGHGLGWYLMGLGRV
jgi:hypothetical protein